MPSRLHDDNEQAALGEMIRRLREQAEMTQQELAFRVGTSTRSVQRWEQRGAGTKPDGVDLLKVLAVFGIEVPDAPRFTSLSHELRQIYDRLDALALVAPPLVDETELAGLADELSIPSADAIAALVHELNGGRPNARRRAQMRQVADELAQSAQMALRVAVALRARLEAAGTGR